MRTQLDAPCHFEIKIAVLGYVSAGKTTVINALLRDKFGEVSMRRTTAGVNYFRLSHHQTPSSSSPSEVSTLRLEDDTESSSSPAEEHVSGWTVEGEEVYCTAEATLREITADNAKFRESTDIHVKYFDIQMKDWKEKDSFFFLGCGSGGKGEMLENTKLVLVDIPGINEAGAGGKYRSYVTDHWETFDCAIVVMDGRQGANTEEQVSLLEFVKRNNDIKSIPVIILCNKVDDPEDEEQAELVQEARQEVERIFDVPDRVTSLQTLLTNDRLTAADYHNPFLRLFPAFIPTSAILAYIYRTAALMSLDQFQAFDKNLIEKLGRKEVGWKWRKLPEDQKIQLAYEAVSDPILYQDRMEATNFDKILKVLECTVGGKEAQLKLIQKQIDVDLRTLSTTSKNIALKMQAIYAKCQLLGQNMSAYCDFKSIFWSAYTTSCEKDALRQLSTSPLCIDALASAMNELLEYYKVASLQNWKDEQERTIAKMKHLVRRQFATILSQESLASTTANWAAREAKGVVDWESIHPLDWLRIFQSLLLLSYDRHFCQIFGNEKMVFETLANKWMIAVTQDVCQDFGDCKNGCLLDLDAGKKKKSATRSSNSCGLSGNGGNPFGSSRQFAAPAPVAFAGQAPAPMPPFSFGPSSTQGFGFAQNGSFVSSESSGESKSTISSLDFNYFCNLCYYRLCKMDDFKNVPRSCQNPSLRLMCPCCSKPLNVLRQCDSCHTTFYLKTKDVERHYYCTACERSSKDGRCSSGDERCDNRYKWKELPYASLNELLSVEYNSETGTFRPKYPQEYKSVVHLSIPQSLSDPKHYGHVAWLYCQFMATLKESA